MRLFFLPLLIGAILTFVVADSADALDIVRDGKPVATVVCADDASAQLKDAVGVLRDCIAESSGARLDLSATAPETGNVIYVGPGPWVEAFKVDQKGLDDDGFEILFPEARSVLILGPTDWGTEFGVYELLERYVGVRWLVPGAVGTHIPTLKTITVPATEIRQEPAFFERSWSGFTNNNRDHLAWMRTARMPWRYNRVSFHHSLGGNLLPPTTYGKTHPEFFPMRGGKRIVPTNLLNWQPCFSAPGIVEEAARNIIRHFEQNPSMPRTYSLGINDGGGGWCQCGACRSRYSGRENTLGIPDYSDIYYAWCNEVIELVLKKYPDAWFGCLAYNNVFDPPSRVKVHPRLIPYICMDRMQWADPKRREDGHAFHQRWHKQCPTLGWYDYIYGKQYKLPRVYFHRMADNLRYARQNGVRAFYAEAYPPNDPNWGEGPKLYVTARLLWNPYIDVDEVLRDWYVSFAGEDAADDLARYYRHWEDFWTRRVLKTRWFGQTDSPDYRLKQYLDFGSIGYLEIVSFQEMEQCRRWLESALAKARTDQQRARVRLLLNAFEKSEAIFGAGAGHVPAQKLPEVTVPLIAEGGHRPKPSIDGMLENAYREHGVTLEMREATSGGKPKAETRVYVARDKEFLYVLFSCAEPRMSDLRLQTRERDDAPWRDDCVEVLVDRAGDGKKMAHIIVTAEGSRYDAMGKDLGKAWNPEYDVALTREDKSWTAELRIPFAIYGGPPRPGETWRMNFCRERYPVEELSAWSITLGGGFTNARRFGSVRFK